MPENSTDTVEMQGASWQENGELVCGGGTVSDMAERRVRLAVFIYTVMNKQ